MRASEINVQLDAMTREGDMDVRVIDQNGLEVDIKDVEHDVEARTIFLRVDTSVGTGV